MAGSALELGPVARDTEQIDMAGAGLDIEIDRADVPVGRETRIDPRGDLAVADPVTEAVSRADFQLVGNIAHGD
jgi:hypothetical protein